MKTSFIEVMGSSPINKVLDFLIENDRISWTMMEIKENAKVGYATLKLLLPKLLEKKLLIVEHRIGKIKLYTINKESSITQSIISLYGTINEEVLKCH